MYSLLLDTSTEKCLVALAKGSEIIFHSLLPAGLQSAQLLLPELHKGLRETNLEMQDLSFVCTGIGPGSYTGMRVGATVAKTLAFCCGIPLIGVCSLDLFAPQSQKETSFAAVIDAKIGGLYVQKGRIINGKIESTSSPHVYSITEAVELLRDVCMIVTPNSMRWRQKLEDAAEGVLWQWEENYPSPVQMLTLALKKYASKDYSLDGRLELLYMRKTQAEIEKESKNRRIGI